MDGCDVNPEAVLALWCFIDPLFLKEAAEILRELFPSKFKKTATCTCGMLETSKALTQGGLEAFANRMGEKGVLVRQKSGDVVFVPPGHVHCVLNLVPCIKVAHDRFVIERFLLCAKAAFKVGCGFMYLRNGLDYMAWARTAASLAFCG